MKKNLLPMHTLLLALLVLVCALFWFKWPPAFFELLSRSFLVRVVFCVAIFGLSIVWFEIAIGRPARELVVDSAVRRALAQKQAFDKAKTNTASGEDPGDSIESKP
ncbi:MAG TPA: hypothetical protein PK236_11940 [Verrucomicrobiota bacterium]|nr:hypothetical protein [Verrucomicrobiota bacterium]